jgi:transcriptional regulator with XRE-family HTH domain
MGIGARIRQLREKLGLSQAELAHIARVRQPSVAQWETEKTEPTRPTLRRVADALAVSPHFLEFGDESRLGRGANAQIAGDRSLPVYGMSVTEPEAGSELTLNLTEAIDYVRRPPVLANAKDAYAIYLADGSMAPWRRQGQIIYVNPARPVACDDHVVVQLKPTEAGAPMKGLIKLLVELTARDVTLRQYNPLQEITIARSSILSMHRVMDWDELLQF